MQRNIKYLNYIPQVHVIDAGFARENIFDSTDETTGLETVIMSQACAKQRSGRAGRVQTGICYRLYAKEEYEKMAEYSTAEISRISLVDVRLKAKLFAVNLKIEDFLSKAIQPPSKTEIPCSIVILQKINALDTNQNLGHHLANMPCCFSGKAVLYAIILRCVNPVVDIVSALS